MVLDAWPALIQTAKAVFLITTVVNATILLTSTSDSVSLAKLTTVSSAMLLLTSVLNVLMDTTILPQIAD